MKMSTKTAIGNEKPSGLDGIPIAAVAPNLTSEADLPPSENLQQPSRDTAEDGVRTSFDLNLVL